MSKEPIGRLTCPHCGNPEAVILRQQKGGLLYYKCYGGPKGDCGTVQPYGPAGQAFIRVHLDDSPAEREPEFTPAPSPNDPEPAPRKPAAAVTEPDPGPQEDGFDLLGAVARFFKD